MANATLTYRLIRSRRRRRSLALRIMPSGEVVVRAPVFTPKFLIDRFVRGKSEWISNQLSLLTIPTKPAKRYFTNQALKSHIKEGLDHYSAVMGLNPSAVRYKSVRSYWGNCSGKGVLSFNLQLAYAPPKAVTYVVVHELAHLKWRGHGKRFWNLVTNTYPGANDMRKVLRQTSREQSRNI